MFFIRLIFLTRVLIAIPMSRQETTGPLQISQLRKQSSIIANSVHIENDFDVLLSDLDAMANQGLLMENNAMPRISLYRSGLENFEHIEYIAMVGIGSTGKKYRMLMDTGSSDIWIKSHDCIAGEKDNYHNRNSCRAKNHINLENEMSRDPEIVDLDAEFSIKYVKGFVSGRVYQTSVSLAGLETRLPIGIVNSADNLGREYDGIFGLGFDWMSKIGKNISSQYSTFVDKATFDLGLFNIFGLYLSLDGDDKKDGEIVIGGYDPCRIDGDSLVFRLTNSGKEKKLKWEIDLGEYQFGIGNSLLSIPSFESGNALIDSGTTTIMLPDKDLVDEINQNLGAEWNSARGGYFFKDCTDARNGPDVTINFAKVQDSYQAHFSIPAKNYVMPVSALDCKSQIIYGSKINDKIILGVPFLRSYYAVFDKEREQISLAKAKHSSICT